MKRLRSPLVPMLCIAALLALLPLVTAACGMYKLKYPEEINMADMSGHADHADHAGQMNSGSGTASDGGSSCADMTEASSSAPTSAFDLTAYKTKVDIGGRTVSAWTFDGTTPGPELRVQQGDRVIVNLNNKDIDSGVTIHWHGIVLPCSQDGVAGVTQDAISPGESFTYEFIAGHAGTYWYHSHQQSSEQAQKGLIGRLIVEPREDSLRYDRDYAVTLQKLADKHWLTNGKRGGDTLAAKPGERIRLRLINSSSEVQWMGVAGADFQVVSMDGQDLNGPDVIRDQWIPIGGGQRYDVLLAMPQSGQVEVYSRNKEALRVTLGEGTAPALLDKKGAEFDLASYGTPLDDGVTADMTFDREYELVLGLLDINGKRFHDIPPLMVKEGEWIKITLKHEFGAEHPMHMHGHLFKVLTKNGKPLTGSPVYADSVLLFQGDEYEIAFQANNPGLWMEHCHNLGHAANGMSMMINYEGVTTPYRVGTKSGNLPD
ncbi:multicopper oxidase family protein [Paenibacillus sp. MY03]|jgi:FtsP/CotA-like multicopper oxidase with cupredoxin domain|uniref:multicopper oxidase family protein n=1 Tax=Paenibacillus sp. MY03 TaxID=302980 RepID=UPI000B3D4DA3|nr:multicopper oxidase family protein [Paenibacillus sp. MY03]